MPLNETERAEVKRLIDEGRPLPDKYRHLLFAEPREAELIWPGKTHEVTNVVLPFQSIEQIDEPRAEVAEGGRQPDLFQVDRATGRQSSGWTNKLIWGDNKLVLSSLKNGPLRREIENAGGLKLVYIDPPFDVGADFSFRVEVGTGDQITKEPSIIEELAYRDTWGSGADSYVNMIYERLQPIKEMLANDGSVYVHVGWQVSGLIRSVCDEIFGRGGENGSPGFRSEIIWQRTNAHADSKQYGRIHDTIFFYTKSATWTWNKVFTEFSPEQLSRYRPDQSGRLYTCQDLTADRKNSNSGKYNWRGTMPSSGRGWGYELEQLEVWWAAGKIATRKDGTPRQDGLIVYLDEKEGKELQDVWSDVPRVANTSAERLGYDTQKPEVLIERVISASSNPGDLVADFFCGSGTTLAVAEKLGRKWIGCDLGRFAIHTARKRLIGVQRELKAAHKPYRSFEILNLGKYERQYFAGVDPTLPEKERAALSVQREEHYLTLILFAYKAERVFQSPPFHGRKGTVFVVVGPLDAPVSRHQIEEAVEACRKLRTSRLDVLGFEFEMGVSPQCVDAAKAKGVTLALRYIPKEVFDKRAVDKSQVVFYDVAYVEIQPVAKGRKVTVKLRDFGVSYRQDDIDALAGEMKAGTKVTVADGQVMKITKDKQGKVTREVLTKKWQDWIDYWSVDFDYHARPETIIVTAPDATGRMVERPQRTGGFIFENEWQSFRTRRDRTLELESAPHEYADKGKYRIAVKVIDIFGNDTTKVVEVSV